MSLWRKIRRLYYTVRHLRITQIVYRLRYKLFPLKSVRTTYIGGHALWSYRGPEVKLPSLLSSNRVRFLNLSADITSPEIWNHLAYEKLWLYNLHYFDDLNAIDNQLRTQWQLELVRRWIKENPPIQGNGWEPYPLSLRLVNWIQWYNRTKQTEQIIVESIALQAEALTKQLEYHIQGNHLFANGKALVFCGVFLQGKIAKRYLELGLKILKSEISEQFLLDGGHFERSPMYHCILLWDILELIQLSEIANDSLLSKHATEWRGVAQRALNFLQMMTHPDGEVSFFNDSAIGIAVTPSDIMQFAEQLRVAVINKEVTQISTLELSGYSRLQLSNQVVIFDHAPVGPDYLPGHAHADTLSFEWSVGNNRILVNSGTSVYGVNTERLRQRQTAAHNCVVIDNEDSSEVWGGFRVARRAYARLLKSGQAPGFLYVEAEHDGYMRLQGKVMHKRRLELTDGGLKVIDYLSGSWREARAVFHLHPQTRVFSSESGIVIHFPSGQSCKVLSDTRIQVEDSTWHPEFGKSVENKKLIMCFRQASHFIEFSIQKD